MKKLMLSWTLVLAVSGLSFVSCKKDKDDNKPSNPEQSTVKDDRDGKEYKTVTIGTQTWFAENLQYNGTISAGYITNPYGSVDSSKKYGQLYTFDAAKIVCPKGWHLPLDSEWRTLEKFLGMSNADTSKWGYEVKRGTSLGIGVKMQKGGSSNFNFIVRPKEDMTEVWTASAYSNVEYYTRYFSKNDSSMYRWSNGKDAAICVRCLKD